VLGETARLTLGDHERNIAGVEHWARRFDLVGQVHGHGADDLVIRHDLGGIGGRRVGRPGRVERLQRDGAVRVAIVELVDGELGGRS